MEIRRPWTFKLGKGTFFSTAVVMCCLHFLLVKHSQLYHVNIIVIDSMKKIRFQKQQFMFEEISGGYYSFDVSLSSKMC